MSKTKKEWHAPNSSLGMGDYHGSGIKNKMGKIRDSTMGYNAATKKQVKTPPKALA